jgi:hypothetical protein
MCTMFRARMNNTQISQWYLAGLTCCVVTLVIGSTTFVGIIGTTGFHFFML